MARIAYANRLIDLGVHVLGFEFSQAGKLQDGSAQSGMDLLLQCYANAARMHFPKQPEVAAKFEAMRKGRKITTLPATRPG
jgi:hypothetical protein